jgi:long-subunit fatty acid transport protein
MKIWICILMMALSQIVSAQSENIFDKMYFGGGFGLDFNQNVFSFSLTPYAGYKLTERWSAGLGINYQFWRDKILDLKINNYGGNIFARYSFTPQIFGSTKLEYLSVDFINKREGFYNLPVGLGYVVPISKFASLYMIGQYDLLYDVTETNGAYSSPWILEAGFGFGF